MERERMDRMEKERMERDRQLERERQERIERSVSHNSCVAIDQNEPGNGSSIKTINNAASSLLFSLDPPLVPSELSSYTNPSSLSPERKADF